MRIAMGSGAVLILSDIDEEKIRALSVEIPNNTYIRKCKSGVAIIMNCRGGKFVDTKIELSKLNEKLKEVIPDLTSRIKLFATGFEESENQNDFLSRW